MNKNGIWSIGLSIFAVAFLSLAIFLVAGCTDNNAARQWGGEAIIDVANCEEVVNVTWKEASLWILTRPMPVDEEPETWHFREDSPFDMMEGTVILREHCDR